MEQSGPEKLHAGDQGSGDIWQLHLACGYEGGMQIGPQGWPAAGAVEGCVNARERQQLTLMEMVLGCRPPPGCSLGQEAEGKAASSGCQPWPLPRGFWE